MREKRAIVTDIPGTTRDTIEEYVNIGGILLKIIDTAGIRQTNDLSVEQIGVERAKEPASAADLVLILLDASAPLSEEDKQVLALLRGQPVLILVNKTDLPQFLNFQELEQYLDIATVLRISVQDGTGLADVEQAIVRRVYSDSLSPGDGAVVANVRHIHLLGQAKQHLLEARSAVASSLPPDCIVVDLRAAWSSLGEISGDTAGDDSFDQIFFPDFVSEIVN